MLLFRYDGGTREVYTAERHRGIEHTQLAAVVLEQLDLLASLSRRARGDAVTVRAEDHAAELPEDRPLKGVDRVRRIQTSEVGGEHVGVGLLTPLGSVRVRACDRHALLLRVLGSEEEEEGLADTMPNAPLDNGLCTPDATPPVGGRSC